MGKGKKSNLDSRQKESEYIDNTVKGEKKDMSVPMLSAYNPFQVEASQDSWQEAKGFYKPQTSSEVDEKNLSKNQAEKFIMVLPPPNVTGQLHIGHALMCTVQDCLVRWNRMNGKNTLQLPGLDHAGIATQSVVERQLRKERNLTRHDLGRERFVQEVWNQKREYGGRICKQIRKLGSSVDQSREVFTMDEKMSRAVIEAFVRMHNQGKIYRATRLVNQSCCLNTAIADCEVERKELTGRQLFDVPGHKHKVEFGVMHKFGYKFVDSEEQLLIETTRPETLLADTAVAVHPDDPRYKHLIGKYLQHPFVDRKLPIIGDSILVDMEKGTGVVKVTPAHDHNDYECGQRHNLEQINLLTEDGRINENGGSAYCGMMRFDCKFNIIQDLKKLNQYYGKRDNPQALGFCSRSHDVIEYVLRSQQWVDCKESAEKSIAAVKNGELEIIPKRDEKVFFYFMEQIRPQCISRQLQQGHRIPAYIPIIDGKKLDSDLTQNQIIAPSFNEARQIACERWPDKVFGSSLDLQQDEDVLDTQFSSGLFPFAVFGWPDQTLDLKNFYPGTLLETGRDILFFWVCRMLMMSYQLNDCLPFKQVLLHPMVRAADGSKMSKSKGSVIDPLHVIEGVSLQVLLDELKKANIDPKQVDKYSKQKAKEFPNGIPSCGADALRFALLCFTGQGDSINLNVNVVVGYRQHCNKLQQAANFALPKFNEPKFLEKVRSYNVDMVEETAFLSLANRWILSRLNAVEQAIDRQMRAYDLSSSASSLYDFWLKEICDVYLELIKPIFYNDNKIEKELFNTRMVLYTVFDRALKLLHPFMPFISEELQQRLPGRLPDQSIMVESYPVGIEKFNDQEAEEDMKLAQTIARSIRSTTVALGLGSKTLPHAYIQVGRSSLSQENLSNGKICEKSERVLRICLEVATMSNCRVVELLKNVQADQDHGSIFDNRMKCVVDADIDVQILLEGLVDYSQQIGKLKKQKLKLEQLVDGLRKKLENPKYLASVADNIKQMDSEKLESRSIELKKLEESLEQLQKAHEHQKIQNQG